jgi:catechol 2,3-dioxygenase-like lactoylglutathione lyase family enzyme
MIDGVHVIVNAKQVSKARAFFKEVLGYKSVDAGDGWLIFALPPAELAFHPTRGETSHELFFTCKDIDKTVAHLKTKGVKFRGGIKNMGWGLLTSMKIPGAGEVGLYQPMHPIAHR